MEHFLRREAERAARTDADNASLGWGRGTGNTSAAAGLPERSAPVVLGHSFELLRAAVELGAIGEDVEMLVQGEAELRTWLDTHKIERPAVLLRLSPLRLQRLLDEGETGGEPALPLPLESLLRGYMGSVFQTGPSASSPLPGCKGGAGGKGPDHVRNDLEPAWPGDSENCLRGCWEEGSASRREVAGELPNLRINEMEFSDLSGQTPSTHNLQMLQCALALAGGKHEELGDYLKHMKSSELIYNVQKLVQLAQLGKLRRFLRRSGSKLARPLARLA